MSNLSTTEFFVDLYADSTLCKKLILLIAVIVFSYFFGAGYYYQLGMQANNVREDTKNINNIELLLLHISKNLSLINEGDLSCLTTIASQKEEVDSTLVLMKMKNREILINKNIKPIFEKWELIKKKINPLLEVQSDLIDLYKNKEESAAMEKLSIKTINNAVELNADNKLITELLYKLQVMQLKALLSVEAQGLTRVNEDVLLVDLIKDGQNLLEIFKKEMVEKNNDINDAVIKDMTSFMETIEKIPESSKALSKIIENNKSLQQDIGLLLVNIDNIYGGKIDNELRDSLYFCIYGLITLVTLSGIAYFFYDRYLNRMKVPRKK